MAHEITTDLTALSAVLEPFVPSTHQARFYEMLKTHGALLSGGTVLMSQVDEATRKRAELAAPYNYPGRTHIKLDIDIYVPITSAVDFLKDFSALFRDRGGLQEQKIITPTLYCQSFLNKNGIKRIYTYRLATARRGRGEYRADIMIVRSHRTPLQVVNNFDLTFCQTWCDGSAIYATHPEDIRKKHGSLQGEYIPVYITGNRFLHERVKKYRRRGFTVDIPQSAVVLPPFKNYHNSTRDRDPADICAPVEPAKMIQHWVSRAVMLWLSGASTNRYGQGEIPGWTEGETLTLPFRLDRAVRYQPQVNLGGRNIHHRVSYITHGFMGPGTMDGYDSESEETATNEPFIAKAQEIMPEDTWDDAASPELNVYRRLNRLLLSTTWSSPEYTHSLYYLLEKLRGLREVIGNQTYHPHLMKNIEKLEALYAALKERCMRKGTCFVLAEENVPVFDLHRHPIEAGISAEALQGHLEQYMAETDKSRVPCYYRPGNGNDCSAHLTLPEIKCAVEPDFYWKFAKASDVRRDLSTIIEFYNATLQNTRQTDQTYGDIFQQGVCPFCLEPVTRDGGCAYMTHRAVSHREAPFCRPNSQSDEQIQRYMESAARLLRGEYGQNVREIIKLSFCVECGRPCANHLHFTHADERGQYEFEEQRLKPDGHPDYGVCAGGGRAELFARILAIREIYRQGGTDAIEERRRAIAFAEEAAQSEEWLVRGRAILEMPESERQWGNAPLPPPHDYEVPDVNVDGRVEERPRQLGGLELPKKLKKLAKRAGVKL